MGIPIVDLDDDPGPGGIENENLYPSGTELSAKFTPLSFILMNNFREYILKSKLNNLSGKGKYCEVSLTV